MPPPLASIDWPTLPWAGQSNAQLARALGCSVVTVWTRRHLHAPQTISRTARRVSFKDADWSQRDTTIAATLGCSASRVATERRMLGCPKQPRQPGSGRPTTVKAWLLNPALNARENALILGCSAARAITLKRELRAWLEQEGTLAGWQAMKKERYAGAHFLTPLA